MASTVYYGVKALSVVVLRKLVVYGFKDASKEQNANKFLQQCLAGVEKIALSGN